MPMRSASSWHTAKKASVLRDFFRKTEAFFRTMKQNTQILINGTAV